MTIYPSFFDNKISVSQTEWAVTMICNAREIIANNHAMLIVEKVVGTELVRQILELQGPGILNSNANKKPKTPSQTSINPPNDVAFHGSGTAPAHRRIGNVIVKNLSRAVRYTHKSETWLRSAEKVQAMITCAEQEQDRPSEFPRAFFILGDRSALAKKVPTFKITDPLINALARNNTKLFSELYERTQKFRDEGVFTIKRLNERYFDPLEDKCPEDGGYNIAKYITRLVWSEGHVRDQSSKILGVNQKANCSSHITESRCKEIGELFAATSSLEEQEQLIQNAPETEKEFFAEVKDRIEKHLCKRKAYLLGYFKKLIPSDIKSEIIEKHPELEKRREDLVAAFERDAFQACKQLMYDIYQHAKLCHLQPDSCFTWAREKLAMIDVEIQDKGVESLVSPTRMYLKRAFDSLWAAYQGGSCLKNDDFIAAFKERLESQYQDLRLTEKITGRTLLHALAGDNFKNDCRDQLVRAFCQEFKTRYPESYQEFLHQKIPGTSLDALDIAVNTQHTAIAQFLIEEGVSYKDRLPNWAQRAHSFEVWVTNFELLPYITFVKEKTPSYYFILQVFAGNICKDLSPNNKADMLYYCCSSLLSELCRVPLCPIPLYAPVRAAQALIRSHMIQCSKHDIKHSDSNNGPLLIVLKSPDLTWAQKLSLVQLLLEGDYPDDVNQANIFGETPLIIAAQNDFSVLNALLQRKEIEVNKQSAKGNTALHRAVAMQKKQCLEALIAHKDINPNIQNHLGQTPLHLTWDRGVIRLLMEAGADDTIPDHEGKTAREIHETRNLTLRLKKAWDGLFAKAPTPASNTSTPADDSEKTSGLSVTAENADAWEEVSFNWDKHLCI